MENRNLVITLSGEPVSGKSTTYTNLKRMYESNGYTVVKFSTGSIFRKMANEKNMSVLELNLYAKKHPEVDKAIDSQLQEIGERLKNNYHPNAVFIIDSRMAWNYMPDALDVRLTLDSYIAGRRVFTDSTRDKEDKYSCVDEAIEVTKARKLQEQERYKKLYNVDLQNPDNYDLVIDTVASDPIELANLIYECAQLHLKNEKFPKYWKTPKAFLPTKDTRIIFKDVKSKLKVLADIAKRPLIYALEDNGYDYVVDGHHRIGASILSNTTLVPYILIDNKSSGLNNFVIDNIKYNKNDFLKSHCTVDSIKHFEDKFHFRYTDVYRSYPYNNKSANKNKEEPEI